MIPKNLPQNCIIRDAHNHIFPEKIAEKATASIGDFYGYPMCAAATGENLIAKGKEVGIETYLVCSSAVTAGQVESINDFIASQCRLHPEFYGLAAMHPGYADFEKELDRALELGLHGVKLHPDFQKFNIDDEAAIPMYRAMAKRGMPVLFHMGDARYDFSAPERLANVMKQVPDLKVQAAHFGGHRCWDRVGCLDKGNPNLVFDTSSALYWLKKEEALGLFEHFGLEHFLYGTDFPMWDCEGELMRFLSLGLSESENRAVLGENFAAFYTA